MKKIIVPLFFLILAGCDPKEKPATLTPEPMTYPFGYNLKTFEAHPPNEVGGGDCWSTIRHFSKNEISIWSDSNQCSEYTQDNTYYLLINDTIAAVHEISFVSDYDEKAQKPIHVTQEDVYHFAANPPTYFSRKDTLPTRDIQLMKSKLTLAPSKTMQDAFIDYSNMFKAIRHPNNSINDISFSIIPGKGTTDKNTGVPKTEIYIESSVFPEPILLTNDFNIQFIESQEDRDRFGIPENVVFAFHSWFAGGGTCYFGIFENKSLMVYSKELDEQIPQGKEDDFRRFKVFQSDDSTTSSKYFICFTGDKNNSLKIMVAFQNDKATYIKYQGQTATIPLEFEKEEMNNEGAYPVTSTYYNEVFEGKVSGTYKLTHSGIWDYLEYRRGKDGKVFNFTINHDDSIQDGGYTDVPCY